MAMGVAVMASLLRGIGSRGRAFRANRLARNTSCSETGSTSGPSVVMLALSEYPAIAIRSLLRCTPTCVRRRALMCHTRVG